MVILFILSCSKDNNPPYVTEFTVDPESVFPGDTVNINFIYGDEDQDQVFRTLSCEIGELIPSDPDGRPILPINWIAPKQVGEFWFWLDINDGEDYLRDSVSVIITDTLGTFIDSRDNHEYKWVKIGQQIWMAKNLAYLPDLEEMLPASFTEPFYYVYDYREKPMLTKQAKETQNYKTYGVIYNLPASKTSVCPDGWHVSSGTEWEQLIDFVGENSAQKLRAKVGWDQENEELDITRSGFDALPGGILGYAESSGGASYYRQGGIGKQAWFWNSEGNKLWKIDKFSPEVVESGILSNPIGASVRCVKDE